MYAFDIPRNYIAVLAALVLTLALSAVSANSAVAEEMSTIEGSYDEPVFTNAARTNSGELRHLLSQPGRSVEEQRLLERTLNEVYEELADAGNPVPTVRG